MNSQANIPFKCIVSLLLAKGKGKGAKNNDSSIVAGALDNTDLVNHIFAAGDEYGEDNADDKLPRLIEIIQIF